MVVQIAGRSIPGSIFNTNLASVEIFALLTTIVLVSILGFIDDLFGWAQGGLSMKIRILLVLMS